MLVLENKPAIPDDEVGNQLPDGSDDGKQTLPEDGAEVDNGLPSSPDDGKQTLPEDGAEVDNGLPEGGE